MEPALDSQATQGDSAPPLAPGAPMSPERTALISAFRQRADGVDKEFEARTHKGDWTMPYRLFVPRRQGSCRSWSFLHGSGGLGTDNVKQMGLGNVFGTRVWALPENQKDFPCYVVAPQTDRGWVRYGDPSPGDPVARVFPDWVTGRDSLSRSSTLCRASCRSIRGASDVTGQSMGGAGAWHLLAQRPRLFAAAAICCGSPSSDNAADSVATPLWNFHGDADNTVPVAVSRDRIAALRKAGGHPLVTEYAGVGHNVWEWAYAEPALVRWMFSKRRPV